MPVLGIRPTVDIVFKLLFGNADHPGLTVSLLNAILPVLGRPRVRSVQILNPYTLAEFSREKEIVVDVRARDESGHDYQIEMQVESHPDLPRRMLDNWSRLYRRQIKKGQDYLDHNSLICVWILEEPLPDMPLWLDAADLTRRSDGSIHNADFLLIIIQLGRWRALFQSDPASPAQVLKTHEKGFTLDENILAELQGCMYLLAEGQELDPKNLPAEADRPWIREAVEVMKAFTKEDAKRDIYDRQIEAQRVKRAQLRGSREEGIAIGEAKGLRATARKMKALGLPLETITAATGLASEEVAAL